MPTGWNARPQAGVRDWTSKTKEKEPEEGAGKDQIQEVGRKENFVPEEPIRSLKDLVVSAAVQARIDAALGRIRYHDVLYQEWNLQKVDPRGLRVALNLFGPPGTGKTFCAEAIAKELDRKIITVNYAEIESKYVGETPKNIVAAFDKARETDSVLFFDEADSILGKRLTNVTQSADHGVNVSRAVMLTQLDKFSGIVVFATNLARNYDAAFVRRILAHVELELPDEGCRTRLWQFLLPREMPREDGITPEWLAAVSDGLAGGDFLNVVIASASRAVQRQGELRRLLRSDLEEELRVVRLAKEKVGAPPRRSVTEEEVPLDRIPSNVRASYEEVMG